QQVEPRAVRVRAPPRAVQDPLRVQVIEGPAMKSFCRFLLAASLAIFAGALAAQGGPVGRVLLASGDAFAVRGGQAVRLEYNSPVEIKDTLRTGAASSLQVRFVEEG